MKKKILYVLAIVVFSACSSESEGIDTATDNNLSDIGSKLENLKVDKIQEQESSNTDLDIDTDFNFSRASKTQSRTSLTDDYDDYCQHEESYSDTYGGETFETTLKYFDKNGNATTFCDLDDSTPYITEQTSKITGSNYVYDWFTTSTHEQTIQTNSNAFSMNLKVNSELTGTLNFDGDIFNIVDGSYFNLALTIAYDLSQDYDYDENFNTSVDLLYKIEFDTNGATYHFDMSMQEENLSDVDEDFESEYTLFNSSNKKIGIVKYIYDSNSGEEYFEVYDLNGDQV